MYHVLQNATRQQLYHKASWKLCVGGARIRSHGSEWPVCYADLVDQPTRASGAHMSTKFSQNSSGTKEDWNSSTCRCPSKSHKLQDAYDKNCVEINKNSGGSNTIPHSKWVTCAWEIVNDLSEAAFGCGCVLNGRIQHGFWNECLRITNMQWDTAWTMAFAGRAG